MYFLLCYFLVDVCFWCLFEFNIGGGIYMLFCVCYVYLLFFFLLVFLDVYLGNVVLYDEIIYFFFQFNIDINFMFGFSSLFGIFLLRLFVIMNNDLNFENRNIFFFVVFKIRS